MVDRSATSRREPMSAIWQPLARVRGRIMRGPRRTPRPERHAEGMPSRLGDALDAETRARLERLRRGE